MSLEDTSSSSTQPTTFASVAALPPKATTAAERGKAPANYFKKIPSNRPLVNPDGAFSIFSWKNVKSNLKQKPFIGRTPPPSSSPNSLFFDRQSNPFISDKAILSHFRSDLLGLDFDPINRFLELTFKNEETYQKYLNKPSFIINEKTYHLSLPKGVFRSILVIHLHGLPITEPSIIEKSIHSCLSPHVESIVEVSPVTIGDTGLLTKKWDVIVKPNSNHSIPVCMKILDKDIVLTWQSSPDVCIHCHTTSHNSQNCQKKPQPRPNFKNTYAYNNQLTTSTQKHPPNNTNDNPISTNLNILQNHSNSDHQQKLTSMSDIHFQSMSNSSPSLYNSMHNPNTKNNMDVDQCSQQNQSQDSQLTLPPNNTINNSTNPTESPTSPSNNCLSESDPNTNTNTDINMTDSSNIVTNINNTEGTQDWTPVSHKKLRTSSPNK